MPANIFINYRKDDTRWNTLALYKELLKYFPQEFIFKDFNTIRLGDDYLSSINEALKICDVLLVIIGTHWMEIKNQKGTSRIFDPEDLVRLEIATAFKRKIKVIPVLFDNMEMFDEQDLPQDLKPLTKRQFISVSDTKFDSDIQRLADEIKRILNEINPIGYNNINTTKNPPLKNKKIKILSIDGGGIRSIIPGTILAQLEKTVQKLSNSDLKLGDYFDMIAGTGTGGILSCLYLLPDKNGKAKYSAQEALSFFINHGHVIYEKSGAKKIWRAIGLPGPKYSADALYTLLTEYFGDTTLDQLIKPSLITSYNITDSKVTFFRSTHACIDAMYNFYVRDVARATSAAPTYFSPAYIQSLIGQKYSLVDGSMFANNPGMCAYAEARKTLFSKELNNPSKKDRPTTTDVIIVSMGTGLVRKTYSSESSKGPSETKWFNSIIDILMSISSEIVAHQLAQLYRSLEPEDQNNYYRLAPGLNEAQSEIDDATPDNINKLYQAGLTFVHDNANMLEELAHKIIEND